MHVCISGSSHGVILCEFSLWYIWNYHRDSACCPREPYIAKTRLPELRLHSSLSLIVCVYFHWIWCSWLQKMPFRVKWRLTRQPALWKLLWWQTNKQTLLKASNALHYATVLGNNGYWAIYRHSKSPIFGTNRKPILLHNTALSCIAPFPSCRAVLVELSFWRRAYVWGGPLNSGMWNLTLLTV